MGTEGTVALGKLAAEAMGEIADEYGDEARVGMVGLVLEVHHTDASGEEITTLHTFADGGPRWTQVSLFREAAELHREG